MVDRHKAPSQEGETIVLVNGFEDLSIFAGLCKSLENTFQNSGLSLKIKLAKKKWDSLKKTADPTVVLNMEVRGWVADKESVTYAGGLWIHDTAGNLQVDPRNGYAYDR